MVNTNKLKGKIVERGMNICSLAETIGIDKATLYRKLGNGGLNITIKDADLISQALKLSKEEANAIFFSQFIA